ncbi:hypothetical protein LYNGBM3L_37330 [Moorena producens 3L]|uniref:Uncharacterized protein n=1 Tax=Moorena producens 3L TaxID=489825 RepID=F4XPY7_9CYAN|nr:hypothetical protein LYNGBM3L_37330 [Moorena producens 3L]OLT68793.1 hypothetical protein BI334_30670 [Moorena producens 3L]
MLIDTPRPLMDGDSCFIEPTCVNLAGVRKSRGRFSARVSAFAFGVAYGQADATRTDQRSRFQYAPPYLTFFLHIDRYFFYLIFFHRRCLDAKREWGKPRQSLMV